MSRKLNIERRRKRIRHYNARRRQRSAVRRAFSYWWSTAVILIFVFFALANTMIWFYPRVTETKSSFVLPKTRESIRYVSKNEIDTFLTKGTFQRISHTISDEDIGISLKIDLPEVPLYTPYAFESFPSPPQEKLSISSMHLLPKAYTSTIADDIEVVPPFKQIISPSLINVGYTFVLPTPSNNYVNDATFFVQTDNTGTVSNILRLAPIGNESDFLKEVRIALLNGRAHGAAQGTIRFQWRKETLK